jgi:hypothetical protein
MFQGSIALLKPISYLATLDEKTAQMFQGLVQSSQAQTYQLPITEGRFLSIYATSDSVASSCESTFSRVSGSISSTETKLESEDGHRLFFKPEKIWLQPVINWIRKGRLTTSICAVWFTAVQIISPNH